MKQHARTTNKPPKPTRTHIHLKQKKMHGRSFSVPPGGKYFKGVNELSQDGENATSFTYCKEETWARFFTPDEIFKFFELANSKASNTDIGEFCEWLYNAGLWFVVKHNELRDQEPVENVKQRRKLFDDVDKHTTALIKLLNDNHDIFWNDTSESDDFRKYGDFKYENDGSTKDRFVKHPCYQELLKCLPKGGHGGLAVRYAVMDDTESNSSGILAQLVLYKMTALALRDELPSPPKGRSRKLDALNAFALEFAHQFSQNFKMPFTFYRHKDEQGVYRPVTPCHQIFSDIVNKVQFYLEDSVSETNIMNSLEYASKHVNK